MATMTKLFPLLITESNILALAATFFVIIVAVSVMKGLYEGSIYKQWKAEGVRMNESLITRYQDAQLIYWATMICVIIPALHQLVAYTLTTVPPNWPH